MKKLIIFGIPYKLKYGTCITLNVKWLSTKLKMPKYVKISHLCIT